jgi:hypothetical protein
MNRSGVALWIGLLLLLSAIFLLLNKRLSWDETYRNTGNNPYDLSLFRLQLNTNSTSRPLVIKHDFNGIIDKALQDPSQPYTYVHMGERNILSTKELLKLSTFIHAGHDVFWCTKYYPSDVLTFLRDLGLTYEVTTVNRLSLTFSANQPDDTSTYTYVRYDTYKDKVEPLSTSWFSLNRSDSTNTNTAHPSDTEPTIIEVDTPTVYDVIIHPYSALSGHKDRWYMIEILMGKGRLLIHSEPLVFSNYYLKTEVGQAYVGQVLSQLQRSRLIFDEGPARQKAMTEITDNRKNPLSYLFKRKGTTYGWLGLLGLGVLYVLFNTRRMERPIPVIPPRKNETIAFIHNMSSLYRRRNAHAAIARLRVDSFMFKMRTIPGISRSISDPEFAEALSEKLLIPKEQVAQTFRFIRNIERKKPEDITELDVTTLVHITDQLLKQYESYRRTQR